METIHNDHIVSTILAWIFGALFAIVQIIKDAWNGYVSELEKYVISNSANK